ncbi:Glycosyl transferase, family 2 [unidentified eubacterium SCB49]|nr:Glycosyl transferase, family 2 [unidentified eubacterium SCB49]
MIFTFLKYIQPTKYFSITRKDGTFVFPDPTRLPVEVKKQLIEDASFKSDEAKVYDLSWQAIQLGYIGKTETYRTFVKLPIVDEYRFIRKYFNVIWVYYIFVLRLLSFKNPFSEIKGLLQSKNIRKSTYLSRPITHSSWDTFDSLLLKKAPLISVVIPTLNRYKYLKDVLLDLEKQEYSNIEVIIVDQTTPFQEAFYKQFTLPLRVYYQEEKALWKARNFAIKEAKGEYLLLFDDDSRVAKNWISNHLKCLDFFNATISSGVSISLVGDKVPKNYSFFRVSDQLDTGNVLIHKSVFQSVGLFDRQFEKQRMGDGEFGLRAHLAGFLNISNPFAERLHLKVGTGGLRQMGSWDGFRPKNWFGPRPIPSVVYFFINYYGKKQTRLSLLKTIPKSVIPYRFKKSKPLMVLGIIISFIMSPYILVQVYQSWHLASEKLKKGPKIEKLA